jgi:hypothetical protein
VGRRAFDVKLSKTHYFVTMGNPRTAAAYLLMAVYLIFTTPNCIANNHLDNV